MRLWNPAVRMLWQYWGLIRRLKRAIYADFENNVNNIILAIAIRNLGTCEMVVPKVNLDPWQLLALIDKAGLTIFIESVCTTTWAGQFHCEQSKLC